MCGCAGLHPCFAYLTQTAAFTVAAGQPIPFSGTPLISDCFSRTTDTTLEILTPGIYRVDYRLHIPQDASVDTTFVVRVGGVDVPGSQQSVQHTVGMDPQNINVNAIFEVTAPTTLELSSTGALTLPADAIVTMSVTSVM